MHPLYDQYKSLINKPGTVQLLNGNSHYGVIQAVTTEGVYFLPMNHHQPTTPDTDYRFFPLFLPFAALAGFTLGAAAGATIPRPYPYAYPYPYPYPYPYANPYYSYPGGYPYYW